MKYSFFIIYLLILFLKNDMNAQSSLELAFIKVLNEYRKDRNLSYLFYDSVSSKITKHHAQYLSLCNDANIQISDHEEKVDIKHFNEMNFDQRSEMIKPEVWWFGEIQIQYLLKRNNDVETAKQILKTFDKSPGHKDIMTLDIKKKNISIPIVAISIFEKKDEFDQIVLSIVVNVGSRIIK